MRVVVAGPEPTVRNRIVRTLAARGMDAVAHERPITDEAASAFHADVVLCPTSEVSVVRLATVEQATSTGRRPYVIGMLHVVDEDGVMEAMASGADDFVAFGATDAELVARAEMPRRISAWRTGGKADRIQELSIWRDAPLVLSQEVGNMFGVPMDLTGADEKAAAPAYAAAIDVVAPDHATEIRLLVGLSEDSAQSLATLVYGGPASPEALADALREIANTIGGAFKRTALVEGETLTVGLPSDCDVGDVLLAERVWTAQSDVFDATIAIDKTVRESRRLQANELQPGMVLRHDVRTASGTTVVRAGTALTERTTERLREYCGRSAVFDAVQPGV